MTEVNQAQAEAWNGDSGHRWVADADRRDRVLQPVADALLAAADLRAGVDVVDIGCGCGMTTLAAARAVAPGHATGVDLSTPMLELARQRAAEIENVTFVRADAQTYDFAAVDAGIAISRFGTMFFDDPVAAFTNIRSAMRADGRLCLATWQPLVENDWLMVPGAALLRFGSLPESEPGAPGMFAQSEPAVIERTLLEAGWRDIRVEPVTLTLRLGATAAEAVAYLADTGIGRMVLETIPEADRADAIAAATEAVSSHTGNDGVSLRAAIFLVHAVA